MISSTLDMFLFQVIDILVMQQAKVFNMSKFHRTASLPHFISAFSNVQFSPALLDLCGYFLSKRYRPPTFHVQAWYDEVRDFSYPYEHECNPYCPFRCSGPVCTHYTQVCLGYIILYSSEFVKLTKFSLFVFCRRTYRVLNICLPYII